jgi:hypothetical protein
MVGDCSSIEHDDVACRRLAVVKVACIRCIGIRNWREIPFNSCRVCNSKIDRSFKVLQEVLGSMQVYCRGVRVVLREFVGNKSDVQVCINGGMHYGSNHLTVQVGVCCGFPLFADVELHSYNCQHLDRVTIHHVESLEDSSNVICLRYMHLTTETLTNNVEAEEL